MKAVILCAGKSTRTYPLTVTMPKVLLKVLGKTLIEHNLEQLNGIVDEVILVVGYMHEMISEKLGDSYAGHKLTYVEQTEQKGTGHALLQAKDHIDGRFILMNGDDLYSAKDLKRLSEQQSAALVHKVDDPSRFGIYSVDGDLATGITEKPKEHVSDLANTGCYVLEKSFLGLLENLEESERGELEVTDAIHRIAQEGKLRVLKIEDYWLPIGYPWNLLEANVYFVRGIKKEIQGEIEDNVAIHGEVHIGKGTIVKSGTYIEGPAYIGEDSVIGPHAYIRPDTIIGDRCAIRSEVYDSVIGDDTKAKHYSYIGHSVLGEDVNIGAGTITADYRHDGKNHMTLVNGEKVDSMRRKLGAFIGDHVRTAINTSIYPGRKIWPWTGTLCGEVVTKDKMDMDLK